MSEQLKHECGIAMIRLRKPTEYYKQKYGSSSYALDKLYLLMEKQHNRGQEAAGVTAVKIDAEPGCEYIFRERAVGSNAINEIFKNIDKEIEAQIFLGHLRYSTTGRHGISYTQPLLRRDNFKQRSLVLAGNFNLTNVDEVFARLLEQGQHPRMYADTYLMLESMGYYLDRSNDLEASASLEEVVRQASDNWDGGYAVMGTTGDGNSFLIRDPWGIRPAFYYIDEEVIVVASERPVIQTVFAVAKDQILELEPGAALMIDADGTPSIKSIHPAQPKRSCSFERIYFSRGSDADIYQERKQLGRQLLPAILQAIDHDLQNTVLSYIPNTAETAFYGMLEGFEEELNTEKFNRLKGLSNYDEASVKEILSHKIRVEKVAIKDIKLRTFIAQKDSRDDLAAHVYDVTYGTIRPEQDNLVIIDDSIVRGTTLKKSIIKMLDRLNPRHIVIVSSCPQVRYPDCYGIDMSMLSEFAAFRAALSLIEKRGYNELLDRTYAECVAAKESELFSTQNFAKRVYEPFTQEEVAAEMALMLTPKGTKATVSFVFQTEQGLRQACPHHTGDWYFTGNFPTPGGNRYVNQAFINWYEGHEKR